jgi:hypothetical protein
MGLAVLWAASLVYSDVIGLTDYVLIDGGHLAFRLPFSGDEVVRTPVVAADMRRLIRQVGALAVLAALLAASAVSVVRRATLVRWISRWPRGAQGAVAAALTLAAVLAYLPVGQQAGLAFYFVLALVGVALLLGGLRPFGPRAADVLGSSAAWLGARNGWLVAGALALALFGMAAAISMFAFDRTAHVVDGVSHLFQARIFSQGRLYLPSHPLREFFDLDTVVNNGRWFSQYTPGHTVLLFLGEVAGASWLVNPLLGALTVLALHALGRELFDEATARVGVVLFVLSPFVLLMSAEYYSHASALLWFTLALLHYARFVKRGGTTNALLAGAFLGLCVLSRPLTALACSLPLGVDALARAPQMRREGRLAQALGGVATVVALCVVLFLYNGATTGEWLAFGYGQATGPGFGVGEADPVARGFARLRLLNDALFALPLPALFLPALAFMAGPPARWDYVLAGVLAGLLLGYAPAGYPDTEFGPRYLYEATGALALLSARGVLRLREVLGRFGAQERKGPDPRALLGSGLVVGFLLAIVLQWYPRIAYYASPQWKWAVHDDAAVAARAAGLTNAIVFVSEPDVPEGDRWWESVFLENALPPEEGSVIFARDLGERNAELRRLYPSREAYLAREAELIPLR